jgi:signal transduction histidine kinase
VRAVHRPARRWWPRSVRTRATVLASLAVAVALAIGSAALLATLRYSLERSGDAAALTRVRDLAALAEAGALPRKLAAPAEDDVVQVVDASGHTVLLSPDAPDGATIAAFRPGRSPVVRTVEGVADGTEQESFRVWAVRAQTEHGPLFVYVGSSLEQAAEATTLLGASLAVGMPALLGLLALGTWLLLGRTLRPVEAIRADVADISVQALDRRVPVPGTGDEIARLATTMNAMLDRLESASRRQREFVADASHELQGPLASFRAQLEVALAHPEHTDWPAVAAELLSDSDRMERVVRDLLFLARADALPPQPATVPVDLDDIVLDEARRLRARAGVRLDTRRVSAAPMRGSGDDLRRMVRNLLDNAVRHARGCVRVEVSEAGDAVVLVVGDDGPGVPEADRDRVFERFVRLGAARSPDVGGTGLGLAIVRAVAERHRGTVVLEPSAAGARFVVRLPSAPQGLGRPSGPVPADRGARSTDTSSSRPAPPETPSASTGPTPRA